MGAAVDDEADAGGDEADEDVEADEDAEEEAGAGGAGAYASWWMNLVSALVSASMWCGRRAAAPSLSLLWW